MILVWCHHVVPQAHWGACSIVRQRAYGLTHMVCLCQPRSSSSLLDTYPISISTQTLIVSTSFLFFLLLYIVLISPQATVCPPTSVDTMCLTRRLLDASSTRPRCVLDNPTECVCTSGFSTGLGPDATATISPLSYRNHHLLMHTNSALHTPTSLYLPVWGIPVLRRRHFHCMIMIHKPTLPR
jgi:hypothetical protein